MDAGAVVLKAVDAGRINADFDISGWRKPAIPCCRVDSEDMRVGSAAHVALVDGFSGAMDLTSALDSSPFFYYSQVVQSVTNGVDEPIAFWGSIQGCNRLIPDYGPFSESTLFNTPSDLVGNQIDFIRLVVNDLQIQRIGATTNFDLSVSYQFWGTPIPEPAALLPLVFCALIARDKEKRRLPADDERTAC